MKKFLVVLGVMIATLIACSHNSNSGVPLDLNANFYITVDYTQSPLDMITSGHYDWRDDNIPYSFLINNDGTLTDGSFSGSESGQVKLNIKLVHYTRPMESGDILKDLAQRSLRPATLPELLAFGAAYPDVQRQFKVVALGSAVCLVQNGHRHVPYLGGDHSYRWLRLQLLMGQWWPECCFAAVPK